MISISLENRRNLKICPKCSSEMGLIWKDRTRSENAYASERVHFLICVQCGYGRTERFVDKDTYPLFVTRAPNGKLEFKTNEGKDLLARRLDAATIAQTE